MTQTAPAALSNALEIQLQSVGREFPGPVVALRQIDLTIGAGEFVAILGPSGCGKSTLLRLVAGLDRPTTGSIALHDGPANDRDSGSAARANDRRSIAFVFQDAHLLPWRTVRGNVELPLELSGAVRAARRAAARQALEQVGLGDAMERYPGQLSGGMKMRASLARALVTRPRLLLLDEPFAALDEITRQRLDEQLRALWRALRMTVVFVTHSTAEASFLADRAVVMSPRPGRIVYDGPIDLPPERTAPLRATAAFAAAGRVLYEALERGGA